MTEKDKAEGFRDGQVDLKIENLEKRMSRMEKLIASMFAAAAAGWAKLQGFF